MVKAESRTARYGRLVLAYRAGVFIGLAAVLLLVGSQLRGEAEAVYRVSDLWDLFLGALFVVVMVPAARHRRHMEPAMGDAPPAPA